MRTVRVEVPERSYEISINNDQFSLFVEKFKEINLGKKIAIITNTTVSTLYSKKLIDELKQHDLSPLLIEMPDGEEYKSQKWVSKIIDKLLLHKFDRHSTLIALGGGVVGDITGFAAATFLRGISFIQFPTTIVAQVDSSVGGKTGINHPKGKNLIGSFYQPKHVFIDTSVLKTLPKRELIGGMAEVLKYGIIYDKKFFDYLDNNCNKILSLDQDTISYIIKRCCEIKALIVSEDEKETTGVRQILNYGHTIGHVIEALSGYGTYRHGEAVAIGMLEAAKLAYKLGCCSTETIEKQKSLLEKFKLPTKIPDLDFTLILQTLLLDKKVKDGDINFILCNEIGSVFSRKVSPEELRDYFAINL